jgi:hypothetical protein
MEEYVWKIIKKVILVVIVIIAIVVIYYKIRGQHISLDGFSFMTDMKDNNELYTIKFEYGGIAYYFEGKENEYFDHNTGKNADAKIKYKAIVNTKIDLRLLDESMRLEGNKVYLTLPPVDYTITIKDDKYPEKGEKETNNFETMGEVSYPLGKLIKACENDARYELNHNEKMKNSIIENSKKSVEALIRPIAEREGYEIEWTEGVN